VSGGHFANNFRPPQTLDRSLPGFDTVNGIFFVNVAAHFGPHREWEDGYKYGFVAAGYGRKWSSQLDRLSVGDIVAAYFKEDGYKKGYVGIGRVIAPSVPVADFRFNGRPLSRSMLKGPDLLHDADDAKECEYLVSVRWIKKMPPGTPNFAAAQDCGWHGPQLRPSPGSTRPCSTWSNSLR